MKVTVFWDIAPCRESSTLMVETVTTSETSINFNDSARRNVSEGCDLQKLLVSFLTTE
jgi:hypothetical protein